MMKLFTLLFCGALCAFLVGCGQTGRTITQTQNFDRCTIYANARPAAATGDEQCISDVGVPASGSVLSQGGGIWTQTQGNEEGTGRNSTPITTTATIPAGSTTTGRGAALGAVIDKGADALKGGDSTGGNAGVLSPSSGSTTDDCADGSCELP
jgi:hypothetical protein